MKKLLVVLLALATVAAFGAVNFSGRLDVTPSLSYDASTYGLTTSIGASAYLNVDASNESTTTGFYVTFASYLQSIKNSTTTFPITLDYDTYVWQKLYSSESLNVTLKAGLLSRGWSYVTGSYFSWIVTPPYFVFDNYTPAVAVDMDIANGDVSDNLALYVYSPTSTTADLDIYNSFSFGFLNVGLMAQGIFSAVSGGTFGFPEIGGSVSADLAEALNIENATLNAFAYLSVDPAATDLSTMLSDYLVGVDFGYDKLSGSLAFAKGNMLGIGVQTKILSPVTLGTDVVWSDLTDVTNFGLDAYASWKTEILNHRISVKYASDTVTLAWRMRVYF